MRTFRYIEQGEDGITPVVVTMTEEQILSQYYEYWQTQMRNVGKGHLISPESCLEDWIVVNWAEEI